MTVLRFPVERRHLAEERHHGQRIVRSIVGLLRRKKALADRKASARAVIYTYASHWPPEDLARAIRAAERAIDDGQAIVTALAIAGIRFTDHPGPKAE